MFAHVRLAHVSSLVNVVLVIGVAFNLDVKEYVNCVFPAKKGTLRNGVGLIVISIGMCPFRIYLSTRDRTTGYSVNQPDVALKQV